MSDLRHPKSKRADVTALVLTLFGLAGLTVSAGGLVGGPALWPNFSGERAYNAQFTLTEAHAPAPRPAAAARPRKPASDELTLRVINESARGICQSEAGATRRPAQAEPNRKQRRPRQPSRRALTFLTAAASGRPANS